MAGSPDVLTGTFAGRYTIERELGSGATATVYLARDTQRGMSVAVKLLRPELSQSVGAERFLREIRLNERLHHPHIVPVLDSGEHEGRLYFVLPHMEEGSLRQLLQREKQLPIERAIEIAKTVAQALDYAHQQNLIHRDVKPENILFTAGQACLADFGIARAVERAIDESTTDTGLVRGTPAYMSPEQASGSKHYDGRSDQYSLACVLYEMLAGVPAFIGPTPEAVIAMRFQHAPRPLTVYRPSVSPALEEVLNRALATSPADRYATTAEFSQWLDRVPRTPTIERRGANKAPQSRRTLVATGATIAALAVIGLWSGVTGGFGRADTKPDTTRLMVLPLEGASTRAMPWRDDDLLQQGLARWRGLSLVDQFQVADGLRRHRVASLDDASSLAASLGAGRYVRGRIATAGEVATVSATLFDVARREALQTASTSVPIDLAGAADAYARLADSLLLRGTSGDSSSNSSFATRSLPAVQAFSAAQRALDEWNLAAADSLFEVATIFDPNFARANVWLAQIRAWQGFATPRWASVADRARSLDEQLSTRERMLADALSHLASGRYDEACRAYTRLAERNNSDFAAWFGLGQCRMMDKVVVEDRTSPSGWRFRSSAHQGMNAFSRAFEVLPAVHRGYDRGGYDRLSVLLLLSRRLVTGYGARDSARFFARPGWLGDSLVLVPYPQAVMMRGDAASVPPGFQEALARRSAEFRRIAAGWSAAYPRSAAAKHAVAVSLELLGDKGAIDTLRLARQLSADESKRVQLAAKEVILMIKFGLPNEPELLRRARQLGDSVLNSSSRLNPESARQLVSVAAMLGRCADAVRLMRLGGPDPLQLAIPTGVYLVGYSMLLREVLGCSPTTIPGSVGDLPAAIDREGGPANRAMLDQMALVRVALMSSPLNEDALRRAGRSAPNVLIDAALALWGAAPDSARALLQRAERSWHLGVPTPDMAYATARLWLLAGDSSNARRVLDAVFASVRGLSPDELNESGKAASLVAAARMRAELSLSGDSLTRARWLPLPALLWESADANLRSFAVELARAR